MRLIDADVLSRRLKRAMKWNDESQLSTSSRLAAIAFDLFLKRIPTVDPVRHAHWINTYGDTPYDPRDRNYWWECSECKHSVTTSFKSNYCPKCGAKMDGESE